MSEFKEIRKLAATLGVSCPDSDNDVLHWSFIATLNRAVKRLINHSCEPKEKSYFCSYIAFNGSALCGYGDMIFNVKATDENETLVNLKKSIIDEHYCSSEKIRVVITSLNKI